jgi:hypothetical protein
MSDTSVVTNGSSKHSELYAMENNSNRRQGNCWTRIGANICVCILTVITILLVIALVYVLYEQHKMEKIRRLRAQKAGKKIGPISTAGLFNFGKNLIGDILDNSDDDAFLDGDDYIDDS